MDIDEVDALIFPVLMKFFHKEKDLIPFHKLLSFISSQWDISNKDESVQLSLKDYFAEHDAFYVFEKEVDNNEKECYVALSVRYSQNLQRAPTFSNYIISRRNKVLTYIFHKLCNIYEKDPSTAAELLGIPVYTLESAFSCVVQTVDSQKLKLDFQTVISPELEELEKLSRSSPLICNDRNAVISHSSSSDETACFSERSRRAPTVFQQKVMNFKNPALRGIYWKFLNTIGTIANDANDILKRGKRKTRNFDSYRPLELEQIVRSVESYESILRVQKNSKMRSKLEDFYLTLFRSIELLEKTVDEPFYAHDTPENMKAIFGIKKENIEARVKQLIPDCILRIIFGALGRYFDDLVSFYIYYLTNVVLDFVEVNPCCTCEEIRSMIVGTRKNKLSFLQLYGNTSSETVNKFLSSEFGKSLIETRSGYCVNKHFVYAQKALRQADSFVYLTLKCLGGSGSSGVNIKCLACPEFKKTYCTNGLYFISEYQADILEKFLSKFQKLFYVPGNGKIYSVDSKLKYPASFIKTLVGNLYDYLCINGSVLQCDILTVYANSLKVPRSNDDPRLIILKIISESSKKFVFRSEMVFLREVKEFVKRFAEAKNLEKRVECVCRNCSVVNSSRAAEPFTIKHKTIVLIDVECQTEPCYLLEDLICEHGSQPSAGDDVVTKVFCPQKERRKPTSSSDQSCEVTSQSVSREFRAGELFLENETTESAKSLKAGCAKMKKKHKKSKSKASRKNLEEEENSNHKSENKPMPFAELETTILNERAMDESTSPVSETMNNLSNSSAGSVLKKTDCSPLSNVELTLENSCKAQGIIRGRSKSMVCDNFSSEIAKELSSENIVNVLDNNERVHDQGLNKNVMPTIYDVIVSEEKHQNATSSTFIENPVTAFVQSQPTEAILPAKDKVKNIISKREMAQNFNKDCKKNTSGKKKISRLSNFVSFPRSVAPEQTVISLNKSNHLNQEENPRMFLETSSDNITSAEQCEVTSVKEMCEETDLMNVLEHTNADNTNEMKYPVSGYNESGQIDNNGENLWTVVTRKESSKKNRRNVQGQRQEFIPNKPVSDIPNAQATQANGSVQFQKRTKVIESDQKPKKCDPTKTYDIKVPMKAKPRNFTLESFLTNNSGKISNENAHRNKALLKPYKSFKDNKIIYYDPQFLKNIEENDEETCASCDNGRIYHSNEFSHVFPCRSPSDLKDYNYFDDGKYQAEFNTATTLKINTEPLVNNCLSESMKEYSATKPAQAKDIDQWTPFKSRFVFDIYPESLAKRHKKASSYKQNIDAFYLFFLEFPFFESTVFSGRQIQPNKPLLTSKVEAKSLRPNSTFPNLETADSCINNYTHLNAREKFIPNEMNPASHDLSRKEEDMLKIERPVYPQLYQRLQMDRSSENRDDRIEYIIPKAKFHPYVHPNVSNVKRGSHPSFIDYNTTAYYTGRPILSRSSPNARSSRGANKGSSRGTNKSSSRGTNKGSSRGTNKGSSRGTNKGSFRGINKGSSRGTNKGSSRGANKSSSRGTNKDSSRGTNEDSRFRPQVHSRKCRPDCPYETCFTHFYNVPCRQDGRCCERLHAIKECVQKVKAGTRLINDSHLNPQILSSVVKCLEPWLYFDTGEN